MRIYYRALLVFVMEFMVGCASGQLIISGTMPGSVPFYEYDIDTTSIQGDSVFVTVSQFYHQVLTHKEDQIFYRSQIIFHGHSCQWYSNGIKKSEGSFQYDHQNNDWKYWDDSGNLISAGLYFKDKIFVRYSEPQFENGVLKGSLFAYDSLCRVMPKHAFTHRQLYRFVDEAPRFADDENKMLEFIAEKFNYPVEQEGIQTVFYISFIVEADGEVTNVSIYQPNYGKCSPADKEMIRVFESMPNWIPGQCHGFNVPVLLMFPVRIDLK